MLRFSISAFLAQLGQHNMSVASSSCLLPDQKHNAKKSCLHLRVFAPKDLSQNIRILSHYCFAYAHSSTVNDCAIVTLLIKRRNNICTCQLCGSCQIAQQGGPNQDISDQLQYSSEEAENCFQQLEAYTNLCSAYQLIYYHPAVEVLLHNMANSSASALSGVLRKIDEQQVDVQSCSMLTAFFTATLKLQQSQLSDTAVYGGMHSFGAQVPTWQPADRA